MLLFEFLEIYFKILVGGERNYFVIDLVIRFCCWNDYTKCFEL